jgi:uncharacterized protein
MPMKKKIFRWVKIILMLYGIIGIAIYYLQDYVIFRPEALAADYTFNFKDPFKEVNVAYDNNSNMNVIQFTTTKPCKGVVLYFHGNKTNVIRYRRFVPSFTGHGYELWMVDYPGYGKSTGPLTEQRLYDYAEQLYKMAAARFPQDSIIIYGKSLGTGIAAWLASNKNCKQVMLETPYYSMTSLAGYYLPIYPVGRMIQCKLPTNEYIGKIKAPVSIFHGTKDRLIPYGNASRLQPLLKSNDRFFTIEGASHTNLQRFPLFKEKLDSLLEN